MKLSSVNFSTVLLLVLLSCFPSDAFTPSRLTTFGLSSRKGTRGIESKGPWYLQSPRLNTNLRAEQLGQVWVKRENGGGQAVEVDATDCDNVDGLIELVKKNWSLPPLCISSLSVFPRTLKKARMFLLLFFLI